MSESLIVALVIMVIVGVWLALVVLGSMYNRGYGTGD